MKNLFLAGLVLLNLSSGAFAAPEEDDKKCQPFNKVVKNLEEGGFSPIWLADEDNQPTAGLLRNQEGNWIILSFTYGKKGKVTACLVSEGEHSEIMQQLSPPPPHSEGT